ncbi:hypothetical protein RchiOBHm_Chr7g0187691 [Rosa chinensis]|uniref:Uncharacterized protein n=1 Tax=Rosa chinensis TaxID=74649 RepID=A0A2P6P4B5_ROSCH|nr:hypothetical protein RchiOBHm_Chr7g0187691 [Rosa chinensis]
MLVTASYVYHKPHLAISHSQYLLVFLKEFPGMAKGLCVLRISDDLVLVYSVLNNLPNSLAGLGTLLGPCNDAWFVV